MLYDYELFKEGKSYIHLPTQKIYDIVMQELEQLGIVWSNGKKATECKVWELYRERTAIDITETRIKYLDRDYYIRIGYKKLEILPINEKDMVKKPNHYIGDNGLEVEEVLRNFIPRYEDGYIAHRISSALEYLLRSPLKNGVEDIEKASYNIQQALEYIKNNKNTKL